jgi:hypothetical protein
VPADLRPWGGATPTTIAEESSGRGQNKTPPVADEVFQPMLAAALHLVTVLGPHTVDLAHQLNADRAWSVGADGLKSATRVPLAEITALLADYEHAGRPLCQNTTSRTASTPDGHRRTRWSRSRSVFWPARPGSASPTPHGYRGCVTRSRRR